MPFGLFKNKLDFVQDELKDLPQFKDLPMVIAKISHLKLDMH